MENALENIRFLYEKDKLSEAYQVLANLTENYKIDIDDFPLLGQVAKDYEESRKILQEFDDTSGWTTEKSGPMKISYKKIQGSPTISLLCDTVIDVPLFHFVTLVYETELYPDWVPFCNQCQTVKRISKSRKVIYSEFDVVKIAKRAVCLEGYGINLLNTDGAVMVISKSVDPEEPNGQTMAKVNFFGCLIAPISENSIHVKVISNFDPCVAYLPYFLLNWVVRKFAGMFFKKITQKTKDFENSKYPERMLLEENLEFYMHLQEALDEYLGKNKKL